MVKTIAEIRKVYIEYKSIQEIQLIAVKSFNNNEDYDLMVFYCAMIELKDRLTKRAFDAFESSFYNPF